MVFSMIMKPAEKNHEIEIEIAHLNLRYAHTRIARSRAVDQLAESIRRYGQVTPVLVVHGSHPQFTLIDGYLRTQALHRLGLDMIKAQVWEGSEIEALIHVLARTQDRGWDAIEQAALIRELHQEHQLSQEKIAAMMGKDQSWVARRLMLINELPETALVLVQKGSISCWSAERILAPMARAMPSHASTLAEHLKKNPLSTRELSKFFDHYRKSNRNVREKMVQAPELFFKTLANQEAQKQAEVLKAGPEGRWLKDMRVVDQIIQRLIENVATVFYPGQQPIDRDQLLKVFEQSRGRFNELINKIEGSTNHAQSGRNHAHSVESEPKINPHSADQPDTKDVP
jgi:ParB/RepB/Spo0J family partition protein